MTPEQAKTTLIHLTRRQNPMNTLKAMIGASNFSIFENKVAFKFKMFSKANYCTIELDEIQDLYNMVFTKIRGFQFKEHKRIAGICWEDLKGIFERETGLFLNL